MSNAPIDELMGHCQSMYKLVVIASKRAKELSEGAPKFVQADTKKVTSVALEEIRQGKIFYHDEEQAPTKAKRASEGGAKAKKRTAKVEK